MTLLGSFNPLAEKVAGLNPKLTALSFRAISRRFHPKGVSDIQPHHWSGEVRVRCLAHGHLETKLGGARDQTSNLPVTTQPFINDLLCELSVSRFRQRLLDDTIEK